eukprot:jgi/Pico_ML_1/54255/g4630.t1
MERRNNCRTKASGFATGGGEELEQVAWSPDIKNRINLIGRAGDKPDIRYLDSGKVVARIGLAVDRPNRNDPDWFDIEVWDTLAEVVANQVGKGQQIAISGFLKMDAWTDRNSGAKRRVVSKSSPPTSRTCSRTKDSPKGTATEADTGTANEAGAGV